MLLNYLKLSLRLLARNPFFTFINVAGLSVGFAVFFVLWQYSQSELKSDQFHKNFERIVRLGFIWRWTDDNVNWVDTQFGIIYPEIVEALAPQFPEIEEYVRVFPQDNFTREHIPHHGKEFVITYLTNRKEIISFKESNVAYADPNLFQFFSIPLEKGDPNTVLNLANSVALSHSTALKYFGKEDPIGKIISINNEISLYITGVFKDIPNNSHLNFSMVISTVGIRNNINRFVASPSGPISYFRLKEGTSIEAFERKINEKGSHYWDEKIPKTQAHMVKARYFLQPLKEIQFSNYFMDFFKPKSKSFLNTIAVMSVLVLLMAWMNYMNLALSANMKRLKEMALRKLSGANITDVIFQFTLEAALTNVIALLAAFTFIQLLNFETIHWVGLYIPAWSQLSFSAILILLGIVAVGILLMGILPGLAILNKTPHFLLRFGQTKPAKFGIKHLLVTFQFSMAIMLIVWSFTFFLQLDQIMKANIGISYQQVILVDLPVHQKHNFENDVSTFIKMLDGQREIEGKTFFSAITGDPDAGITYVCLKRNTASNTVCVASNGGVDEKFIPFFKINLLAGRNFLSDSPSDSSNIILSRAALERMGVSNPQEGVGLKILVNRGNWTTENFAEVQVIGIFEDYFNRSLMLPNSGHYSHTGIILTYKDRLIRQSIPHKVAVRISRSTPVNAGISAIKNIFKVTFPGEIFKCYFLNDHVNTLYIDEELARNQVLSLTLLAIGIACLGLLGMIANKVVEKTKEIGIRKVLGADLHQIAQILLNTTFKQIIIATAIGLPVAHYLTQQYLQKFSERIELQWWHYALPVTILILIMLCTVATVVWKAAKSNPVEALKYE